MTSKNILFFVESISVSSGGTALEVVSIANELATRTSHRVTIVTCMNIGPYFKVDPQITLIILYPQNLYSWVVNIFSLRSLFSKANFIIVTGIWGSLDGLAMRIVLPRNKPYFIKICGMLEPYILNRRRWLKRFARLLYVDYNLKHATGLVVNSNDEYRRVSSLFQKTPVHLIKNGVNSPSLLRLSKHEARSGLSLPAESRIILYLGRLHSKKGLHILLNSLVSFNKSKSSKDSLILLVAGKFSDESYKDLIFSLVDNNSLSSVVRFVGEVSGVQKEAVFSAADVFVLPSASEGLPNAVLEAMIRNLPVIITPGCNIPEVEIYDAGLIVEPNENGITKALNWITGPSEILNKAGNNAFALATSKFSFEQSFLQYNRLIEDSK